MKKVIYLSFFILLFFIGCKKDSDLPPDVQVEQNLPFENDYIKMDLITSSAPANVRDIHFLNSTKAIALTYKSEIFKTMNGGLNWTLQYTNPIIDQRLYQILFTDSNTGFAIGGSNSCSGKSCIPPGGLILKTIDGGVTWTNLYQKSGVEIVSISSNSSGDLFIISNGSKGRISKSTNGGTSWSIIDSTTFQLNKITFAGNFGFCTGMNGNIIRSSDNGNSWKLQTTLDAVYVTDIKFINDIGYCMANNMTVYKTTDFGLNWTKKFDSDGIFYGLIPVTKDICLIYGSAGYTGGCFGIFYGGIGQSINSGSDWTVIPLPEIPSILCTSFYSSTDGYLIGGYNKGYLIKVTLK